MKKRLFIWIVSIVFTCSVSAQPWMQAKYLTKSNAKPTFFEIQSAFKKYWGNKPYEKCKGYKQYKRWEYDMEPKSFPDGIIPSPDKYINEYITFKKGANKSANSIANWTPLGILSWTNGTSGYNPGNGRVNDMCVSTDNNTIYIATPSGGVWKSNNAGQTWNTTFDNQTSLGTSSVVVNPSNPNIVYVGTGDRDASDAPAFGVLKSTDAGATWVSSGLTSAGNINKLIINPLRVATMFAATGAGIYVTYNSGTTWTKMGAGSSEIKNICYKPNDTTVLYAVSDKFIKSSNSGLTFTQVTSGLPTGVERYEIAVTSLNSAYVYLLASNSNSSFQGVYRSTNSGTSFSTQSTTPNILGYAADGSDDSGQGWYDLAIAVSPTSSEKIFIGGVNVWYSNDGGINWLNSSMWYTGSGLPYTHADIHCLKFYGTKLYCGSDGGIFRTDDQGVSWNNISSGLGITQFYRMGGDPNSANLIYAGAQDNGCNKYQSGSWTHVVGADGMECVVDYSNSSTAYVCSQNGGLQRTTDGGDTFLDVSVQGATGGWVTPYVIHPTSPNTIYAAYDNLYVSTSGGVNADWTALTTINTEIRDLAIAPSNPNYLYYATTSTLYISKNAGQTWLSSMPGGSSSYITDIYVNKTNPEQVWVTTTGSVDGVYFSGNAGTSFTSIKKNMTNMNFKSITHDEHSNGAIYLGTEIGIYYTDSTMTQWVEYNDGLPNVIVNELEINYVNNKLRAATYGRGIWESDLYSVATSVDSKEPAKCSIYPNPTNDFVNIKSSSSITKVMVLDVVGRNVLNLNCDSYQKELKIDVSMLVEGTYFVKIHFEGGQQIIKFIKN
ncbi:MAG: T9SS type A sorting domain-containing protein [Bacteroidota bacterium]